MSLAQANSFVKVSFSGLGHVIDVFDNVVDRMSQGDILRAIVRKAATPIKDGYKSAALHHDATGNLAASTAIKTRVYRPGVAVAIAGPRHTGTQGATSTVASGNHSWLVEFGSHGSRSPSTRGKRKTYINVHKLINRKMKKVASLEDSDKFASRSRGYYFLMSSWREPTRQPRAGRGYSHDFLPGGGVFTIHPGETYGAMPAYHLMENTILARRTQAEAILRTGLVNAINAAVAGGLTT